MPPAADTVAGTPGPASVEIQESCPHCIVGYPIPVSGDENGTIYKCLACGYGYGVPADKAAQAEQLATVSAELSNGKLAAIARQNGIDPAGYGSKGELHTAMVQAGKAAQKGKS